MSFGACAEPLRRFARESADVAVRRNASTSPTGSRFDIEHTVPCSKKLMHAEDSRVSFRVHELKLNLGMHQGFHFV